MSPIRRPNYASKGGQITGKAIPCPCTMRMRVVANRGAFYSFSSTIVAPVPPSLCGAG
jgi:hypothetical protein